MTTPLNLWNDLRYSVRRLSSRPGFATVVVLTLAIGVGVNVTTFSLLQQILLRPLPVPEPERLVATERFVTTASMVFAVLATALAGLGLYGVLAWAVAQRSREIGLRLALGAPIARIRGMVFRRVALMAVVGVVLGSAAAVLLSRAASSLLFGLEGVSPIAVLGGAAVLVVVTLIAAHIPARRASRIDPIVVLRYE